MRKNFTYHEHSFTAKYLILGATSYGLWGFLSKYFYPDARDGIIARGLFSIPVFAAAYSIYFLRISSARARQLVLASAVLLASHYFYLLHANLGHPYYVAGLFVHLVGTLSALTSLTELFVFGAFYLSVSFIFWGQLIPDINPVWLPSILLSVLGYYIFGAIYRFHQLNLLRQVEAKRIHLGHVATQVAHDIRSPLGAINTLRSKQPGETLTQDEIKLLGLASDRIQNIAQDLLNSYKSILNSDAGDLPKSQSHTPISQENFSPSEALQELIFEKNQNSSTPISIHLHSSTKSWRLNGSKANFLRSISNLLNNAKDAGSQHIEISVRPAHNHADAQGPFEICIVDDGKGLTANQIEKLNKSVDADSHSLTGLGPKAYPHPTETTPQGKGTGLGIPSARQWLSEMGFQLKIESNAPGKGTRVIVKSS